MKEFVVYTAMRVVLFLASHFGVVVGVMALVSTVVVTTSSFWAVILAFLISGIASYFILNRQREAFCAARPGSRRPGICGLRSARRARTRTDAA